MNSPRTKLYRDKHNGKFMGVCAGIADYTGVDTFWVRLATVFLFFATQGSALLAYLIAGFILNKKPPHLYRDQAEEKYWQRVRQSPHRTAAVEAHYVSSNPRLTAEIERLR